MVRYPLTLPLVGPASIQPTPIFRQQSSIGVFPQNHFVAICMSFTDLYFDLLDWLIGRSKLKELCRGRIFSTGTHAILSQSLKRFQFEFHHIGIVDFRCDDRNLVRRNKLHSVQIVMVSWSRGISMKRFCWGGPHDAQDAPRYMMQITGNSFMRMRSHWRVMVLRHL